MQQPKLAYGSHNELKSFWDYAFLISLQLHQTGLSLLQPHHYQNHIIYLPEVSYQINSEVLNSQCLSSAISYMYLQCANMQSSLH